MRRLALVLGGVVVVAALAATAVTFASSGGTAIEHDSENVTLAAGPGQTVTGETDLDPGTTLRVRLTATDETQPFMLRGEATVAENGSFATAFDMGNVREGATANLTVRHNRSVVAAAPVEVVACDADCEAASGSDQPQSGTTIDRDRESLTLVAGPETKVTGQSDLEPGTELDVMLASADEASPFLTKATATVTDDGSFAATMDTHSVTEPINATLTVQHDGEELTEVDARIESCGEDCDEQSSSAGTGAPQSEFGLEDDVVIAERNETAEISVAIGDADAATLSVGGDHVNYQINATARDENGDGRVVFVLDPEAAGSGDQTMTVRDGGDSVSIDSETDVDGPLSPAEYDLSLYRGSSADGDADDVGTVSLQRS